MHAHPNRRKSLNWLKSKSLDWPVHLDRAHVNILQFCICRSRTHWTWHFCIRMCGEKCGDNKLQNKSKMSRRRNDRRRIYGSHRTWLQWFIGCRRSIYYTHWTCVHFNFILSRSRSRFSDSKEHGRNHIYRMYERDRERGEPNTFKFKVKKAKQINLLFIQITHIMESMKQKHKTKRKKRKKNEEMKRNEKAEIHSNFVCFLFILGSRLMVYFQLNHRIDCCRVKINVDGRRWQRCWLAQFTTANIIDHKMCVRACDRRRNEREVLRGDKTRKWKESNTNGIWLGNYQQSNERVRCTHTLVLCTLYTCKVYTICAWLHANRSRK